MQKIDLVKSKKASYMEHNWSTFKIKYPGRWLNSSDDLDIEVDGKPLGFWGIKELIWVIRGEDKYGLIEIHRYIDDGKTIMINERVEDISINGKRFIIESDNTPEGTLVRIRDLDITNDVLGFILIVRAGDIMKLSLDIR